MASIRKRINTRVESVIFTSLKLNGYVGEIRDVYIICKLAHNLVNGGVINFGRVVDEKALQRTWCFFAEHNFLFAVDNGNLVFTLKS